MDETNWWFGLVFLFDVFFVFFWLFWKVELDMCFYFEGGDGC